MSGKIKQKLEQLRSKQALINVSWDAKGQKDLLNFYSRIMTKVLDADRCSIFIHDPAADNIWLKVGTGVNERQIEVSKEGTVVGDVVKTGISVINNDMQNDDATHKQIVADTGFVPRSMVCVPVKSLTGNEITGAIQIMNKHGDANFTEEDLEQVEELAHYLQMNIENIFLGQEVLGVTERLFKTIGTLTMGLLGVSALLLIIVFVYLLGLGLAS